MFSFSTVHTLTPCMSVILAAPPVFERIQAAPKFKELNTIPKIAPKAVEKKPLIEYKKIKKILYTIFNERTSLDELNLVFNIPPGDGDFTDLILFITFIIVIKWIKRIHGFSPKNMPKMADIYLNGQQQLPPIKKQSVFQNYDFTDTVLKQSLKDDNTCIGDYLNNFVLT
jgi:hypothetical protein